jgi:hypothetical protein
MKGEGVPTRKYDGTCVMFDGTSWWARREIKLGKSEPDNFVYVSADAETGKVIGWEPAGQSGFAKYLDQAVAQFGADPAPGTYELLGPKINGNPEEMLTHTLLLHETATRLDDVPRDFDGLASWLYAHHYEGIVWHGGPNGAMAKLKRKDFPRREEAK